jgi:hypothetical protein
MILNRYLFYRHIFHLGFSVGPEKLQGYQEGLELNGTRQILVYDNDFNLLGENISTINKKIHFVYR